MLYNKKSSVDFKVADRYAKHIISEIQTYLFYPKYMYIYLFLNYHVTQIHGAMIVLHIFAIVE